MILKINEKKGIYLEHYCMRFKFKAAAMPTRQALWDVVTRPQYKSEGFI